MIAVTFALPEESRDFRKALQSARVSDKRTRGFLPRANGGEEIHVIHTGVGPDSASAKMAELLSGDRPSLLISSGYAGGLDPRLEIADLVLATNFSAPAILELCRAAASEHGAPFFGPLTSQPVAVESVEDKLALGSATGALAVDMETGAIAAACAAAGVPLLSVRAISDPSSAPLPVPFEHWFDLPCQRPRPLGLIRFLLRHPSRIAPFARFVRGLAPARLALTDFLLEFLRSDALRDVLKKAPRSAAP